MLIVIAWFAARFAYSISQTTFNLEESKMTHNCSTTISSDLRYPFDARGVAKRFRHAAIFGALDSLNPGETMVFVNDHDPLPLLAQLTLRYGEGIAINYVTREPGQIAINFTRK
jgi:uncharacterized protein (DUF2249 family)